LCSIEDYNSIINATFDSFSYSKLLSINPSNIWIKSFIVTENGKSKFSSFEIIISILAAIILIIPLIINLYLFLFKKIKIKNNNKGYIINKLDIDVNKENEDNEDEKGDEEIIKED